jgi:tripartite-type tricarboxylate transporter receptor subunit TctC
MALLAPARTPPEIVARLHASAVTALADPTVRARSVASGFAPLANSPAEFKSNLARDYERIGEIIRAAGIAAN